MTVIAVICLGLSIFGIIIIIIEIELWSIVLFIAGIILFILEAYTEEAVDGIFDIGGIICVVSGGVTFLQSLSANMAAEEVIVM